MSNKANVEGFVSIPKEDLRVICEKVILKIYSIRDEEELKKLQEFQVEHNKRICRWNDGWFRKTFRLKTKSQLSAIEEVKKEMDRRREAAVHLRCYSLMFEYAYRSDTYGDILGASERFLLLCRNLTTNENVLVESNLMSVMVSLTIIN